MEENRRNGIAELSEIMGAYVGLGTMVENGRETYPTTIEDVVKLAKKQGVSEIRLNYKIDLSAVGKLLDAGIKVHRPAYL